MHKLVIYFFCLTLVLYAANFPGLAQKPNTNLKAKTANFTRKIHYPVRMVYIQSIDDKYWGSNELLLEALGVPGYANQTLYNYIVFSFWKSFQLDGMINFWANPTNYLIKYAQFGLTNHQIQLNLKKRYNDAGIQIMVSAFGSGQTPTLNGTDPITVANSLGAFVLSNNLDGVDIDYQDNKAMDQGIAQDWLIKFSTQLRKILPHHIITHAVQAPYLCAMNYKNGAYETVDRKVGSLIDLYAVQYYNQGNMQYITYSDLFLKASGYATGTSVSELIAKGISGKKILIGKPATTVDVANTGYVQPSILGQWVSKAHKELSWFGGVMFWQYKHDLDGKIISKTINQLVKKCSKQNVCK